MLEFSGFTIISAVIVGFGVLFAVDSKIKNSSQIAAAIMVLTGFVFFILQAYVLSFLFFLAFIIKYLIFTSVFNQIEEPIEKIVSNNKPVPDHELPANAKKNHLEEHEKTNLKTESYKFELNEEKINFTLPPDKTKAVVVSMVLLIVLLIPLVIFSSQNHLIKPKTEQSAQKFDNNSNIKSDATIVYEGENAIEQNRSPQTIKNVLSEEPTSFDFVLVWFSIVIIILILMFTISIQIKSKLL